MSMLIEPEVVLHNGRPIHVQVRDQIRACILLGLLRPGEQLPTVRALAVGLAVNPNAVIQAYAELEREGLVSPAEGSGTFVAYRPRRRKPGKEQSQDLESLCITFLHGVARLGHTTEDALRMLQTII